MCYSHFCGAAVSRAGLFSRRCVDGTIPTSSINPPNPSRALKRSVSKIFFNSNLLVGCCQVSDEHITAAARPNRQGRIRLPGFKAEQSTRTGGIPILVAQRFQPIRRPRDIVTHHRPLTDCILRRKSSRVPTVKRVSTTSDRSTQGIVE